jgi:fatty acid desaturase
MDHRRFVSSLSSDQRRFLTESADRPGLFRLAIHFGAISALGAGILHSGPLAPALMVGQGVLIVFLFTLLHETTHRTPFRSLWLNVAVGRLCGFLLFLPATWFRFFHLAHHRFTQIPGKDPELAAPKPQTRGAWMRHVSGVPVWIGHLRTLAVNASGRGAEDFVPEGRRRAVRDEARLMIAGYAGLLALSVAAGSVALLQVWLLPILLGQPFLRLYLLAEHGRCAFVANMLENSRTTLTNRAVRLLAWNMPYHAEHHAYPTVPFHRLPELHALIVPHLRETAPGYAAFTREYVADLPA